MSSYQNMLSNYQTLYVNGMCSKVYTYDGVLFINELDGQFEAVKFLSGGNDYRMLGKYDSLAEAYSSVIAYG